MGVSTFIGSALALLSEPPLTLPGAGLLVSGLMRLITSGRGMLYTSMSIAILFKQYNTYLSIAALTACAELDLSADAGVVPLT